MNCNIRCENLWVARGWKPGAISKRLLRKLNKAKLYTTAVEHMKPLRKSKKRVEDKPTLIIAKVNGEYHVEMQVTAENAERNVEQYMPLKYKIASADNQEKIKKRERRERRLIREKVKEVWQDPYHPEACENTCLKAYKQAVGLLPFDPNKPECTCSDEEESVELESCACYDEYSSDCSSLDVDWEIHFSPPIAFHEP